MSGKGTSSEVAPSGGARSAARLGAVQALYQIASTETPPSLVIAEFLECRLGREIDGETYIKADEDLFQDIVAAVSAQKDAIDRAIRAALREGLNFDRFERLVRAILRAGTYELMTRPDVPTPVIINEYVDIAHAFYEQNEPGLINGILDQVAKAARPAA